MRGGVKGGRKNVDDGREDDKGVENVRKDKASCVIYTFITDKPSKPYNVAGSL